MTKKKSVKRTVVKRETPHAVPLNHFPVQRTGLSRNKSDGIMAIMAAVLVILTAILDTKISAILAVILMVLFGIYKLFKR